MLDPFFDAKTAEARIYADWEASNCFAPSGDPDAEPYAIVIPPPNVTGVLHMGHALNNTLQDILIRYARMQGKNVLWQAGTDHAGIATQMVVERQMAEAGGNESRASLGRPAFVEKIWDWKEASGGQIIGQLKRLGASCDWSRLKFTMGERTDPDNQMVMAVRQVFVSLYEEGLIYRDKRLVNWDPHFQTAISDLEVELKEVPGHYWHLRYPLADGVTYEHPLYDEAGEPIGTEPRDYIVVATSRPETMLGDSAVAVHPDDARYQSLIGQEIVLPLIGRRIPIVADEYPDPEKGSGAVKITPAHDFNDYEVGKRHDLEMLNILDPRGAIIAGEAADTLGIPPKYHGLDRFKAREQVVADFEAAGLMHEIEKRKIEQPFGDRSGVVIEPWLTDQWYVNAKILAEEAIEAVREEKTRFVPANWEKTYYNWMEDIQPWCISRQLWWGHRIPVWYGPEGRHYSALTEQGALEKAKADRPGLWRLASREEALACDFVEPDGTALLVQDEDVLDTWFSSALWPFSTLGWPDETPELKMYYPGAVLVTAFDIIFFWVARMMMQGLKFMGDVPFRDVYIHALVLDEKGQKMSKSKGNVLDPLTLIDDYGADALRFFLARQATQGRNIRLSKSGIEGYRNFATKIWNAAKFCQMNEVEFGQCLDPADIIHPTHQWIIGELARARHDMQDALTGYRFNDAADINYRFIWNIYCDWYLELIKPILSGDDTGLIAETRRVAGWVFDEMLKSLHPFMPFITEELWGKLAQARPGFLMLQPLQDFDASYHNEAADAELDWVMAFISEIRAVRGVLNIPAGAKPALCLIGASAQSLERLSRHEAVISRRARLGAVTIAEAAPTGSVRLVLGEASLALQVADLIDLEVEKARLIKDIAKLDKEIKGLEAKLSNSAFLSRAPSEIVDEQRGRKGDGERRRAKLQAALDQLSDL